MVKNILLKIDLNNEFLNEFFYLFIGVSLKTHRLILVFKNEICLIKAV
ncbi:hypothetical protein CHRYSEO8AT_30001 [Chryseobacterium sp. 8AT]|nr:hypothetical protein CHRYSEO8AT_30001 [Chryseobacterium sp. 8AT]